MAHPMKGMCTPKAAKLARYANGGSVAVAGYSRSPKKPKGFAEGGEVAPWPVGEDEMVEGAEAPARPDRPSRGAKGDKGGKSHVTNVIIAMPPKDQGRPPMAAPPPAPPPPMMPPGPPMAGPGPAMPPPGMRPPGMKRGGVVMAGGSESGLGRLQKARAAARMKRP